MAYIADRAQPGDGVLIFAAYERIPVEWYMAERPGTERAVHPVYPATAWGVDPLAFDGSVAFDPDAIERAASRYQRIWLLSATADLSLYPGQAAAVDGCTPAGRLHAGRHHALPGGAGHRRGAAVSRPRPGTSLVVGGLVAAATAGHLLYPAWLAWRTRGGRGRVAADAAPGGAGEAAPDLTVVVPAYREAGVIGAKIEDIRANGYPGSLDILVVADGDPETAAAAERAGARALTGPDRLGKSQALNRGFAEATTPIVVISDANNRLAPGALAAVVEHFADPAVGAVAGEKLEDDGGGGESLYWRFESWLKQREDRLGTTIGLVGELSAIRAEAWRPIPADVAIDDLWAALDIIEQGYRVAYEPRARALDPGGGVAGGPVGAPDPQRVRRAARLLQTTASAAAVGGPRRRRVVGAPAGPLHGEPAGPCGPAGDGRDQGALERAGPGVPAGQSGRRRGPAGGHPGRRTDGGCVGRTRDPASAGVGVGRGGTGHVPAGRRARRHGALCAR